MELSTDLKLHRVDVLQSGATAKGTLRVSCSTRLGPTRDH